MNAREYKDSIYNELAAVSKALASPNRLETIDLLAQAPSPVETVAHKTGLSVATASHHLQQLKHARLVSTEKRGKYRYDPLSGI